MTSDHLGDEHDTWAALALGGDSPGPAGESTGRGDRGLLALMTTAELRWQIRGLARGRASAPAGERRQVMGRDLLRMLRELDRRVGRPRPG